MYADKPLYWHQGLFLQPQHFQLADMHQFYRLRAVRKFGMPHFLGFMGLSLREGALEQRTFEVERLEAIFDDGNYVSLPGNARLAPRSFDSIWDDGEKPLMVYLGLRRWNPEGGNVTVADDDVTHNTMFTVRPDPEEVADLLGDGPAAQVRPMHYALRLFFGPELDDLGSYKLMPLARLVLDGEFVRVDRTYVPPVVTMDASEDLFGIFKDISDQVAARGRKMEEYKNPGGLGSGDLDFTSTIYLLALRTLNRYAPMLRHLAEAPHIHPWQAYGLLRQVAGELSSFSREVTALGEGHDGRKLLPEYDHEDLGACFIAARAVISRILNTLTAGPEFLRQLVLDDPYYTAEMPDRAFGSGNSYWLMVRTEASEAVKDEILSVAKLSATSGMSALLARAVHGLPLTFREDPPPGLPQTKGALCFHIDSSSPLWTEVEQAGSISLYWDSAPKDMAAYIAAVRG